MLRDQPRCKLHFMKIDSVLLKKRDSDNIEKNSMFFRMRRAYGRNVIENKQFFWIGIGKNTLSSLVERVFRKKCPLLALDLEANRLISRASLLCQRLIDIFN